MRFPWWNKPRPKSPAPEVAVRPYGGLERCSVLGNTCDGQPHWLITLDDGYYAACHGHLPTVLLLAGGWAQHRCWLPYGDPPL